MRDIDNTADTLDICDIIERIEELREERDSLKEEEAEAQTDVTFTSHGDGDVTGELAERLEKAKAELAAWEEVEAEELAALESFVDEMKGYGGDHQWQGDRYPVTLIRDSYFVDYAAELADDIGAIDRNATWPLNCIDWDKAASELQMGYGSADFDGVTYWYR